MRNDFPGRVPGASRKGPGKAIGEKVVPGDAEVGQREEDEVTQMGARVGEGKGGSVRGDALVKDDVQVDGPRPVAEGSDAARFGLDGVERTEEGTGRKGRLNEERGVEETEVGKLHGDVDGRGVVTPRRFEHTGLGERGDRGLRRGQRGFAIAEVGTECDDGVWHGNGNTEATSPCGATTRTLPNACHVTP